MKKSRWSPVFTYVLFTYLLFWFMVLGVCGVAVFVFDASPNALKWLIAFSSWTPTAVLWIRFRKLSPKTTLKAFYESCFRAKIHLKPVLFATVLIVGLFLLSSGSVALVTGTALEVQLQFVVSALIGNIFFTAIQGASGEESGWRGYLLPRMEETHGFLKGNLYLGLIWGFWHLPLWFISTSYTGWNLVIYIIVFLVGLVSFSIIMAIFLKQWNNLLFAFWLHFLFNFMITFYIGQPIHLLSFYAVFYAFTAVILGWRYKVISLLD